MVTTNFVGTIRILTTTISIFGLEKLVLQGCLSELEIDEGAESREDTELLI
jgi:hypothetical protein